MKKETVRTMMFMQSVKNLANGITTEQQGES